MAEVGAIYVSVMPTTDGISKAIEKEIDGGVNQGSTKGEKSFGKSVGKWVKTAAIATVAAAGLVAGVSLKGGLDRALNIEDAQAKLVGLGHSAETITQIMTDALASVKGTAFGLDEAAETAASAVAAGIKPGQDLEKYLRLTADAATIAGVSMAEMGSIINGTTASGKVYTDTLNQLADRGIPIFQWLADEYGVSAEALSDMVRKGQVDAKTFRKVIEDNIGGAALASGDTTRGAFANMLASLSRIGEGFLSGVFPKFKEGIGGITSLLEPLEAKAGLVGAAFGAWVDKAAGVWESFKDTGIPELLSYLSPLNLVIQSMAPQAGALSDAFSDVSKSLGDGLSAVLPSMAELFAAVATQVALLIGEDVLPALTDIATDVGTAMKDAGPGFAEMAEAIAPLVPKLFELLDPLVAILPPLIGLISALFSDTGNESNLEGVVYAVGVALDIVGGILTYVSGLWSFLFAIIEGFIRVVTGEFTMQEVVNQMLSTAGPIGDLTRGFLNAAQGVHSFVSTAATNLTNFASNVSTKIGEAVGFFTGLPGRIGGALSGASTWLVDAGKNIVQGLINGVSSLAQKAVDSVLNIGGNMVDGVKSFLGIKSPSRVFRDEVGVQIAAGLIQGIDSQSVAVDSAMRHMIEVPDASGSRSGSSGARVQVDVHTTAQDPNLIMRAAGREITRELQSI